MDALFPQPTTQKRRKPTRPRLGPTPQQTHCPKCGHVVLHSQPPVSGPVTVDPHTLTPQAVQAAHILHRRVYRAKPQADWTPGELWLTHPTDMPHYEKEHYQHFWLPEHQCNTPRLPGHPLQKMPPLSIPTEPPY